MVSLPYEKDFSEKQIPTKARPVQMNPVLLEYCKKEIKDLLDKKLIRHSFPHGVVLHSMFKKPLN